MACSRAGEQQVGLGGSTEQGERQCQRGKQKPCGGRPAADVFRGRRHYGSLALPFVVSISSGTRSPFTHDDGSGWNDVPASSMSHRTAVSRPNGEKSASGVPDRRSHTSFGRSPSHRNVPYPVPGQVQPPQRPHAPQQRHVHHAVAAETQVDQFRQPPQRH